LERELDVRSNVPIVAMIVDQQATTPWRKRADFDARAEIAILERELLRAESVLLNTERTGTTPLEPIEFLSFQRFGGFANAVIDRRGLELLRAQPLIARIGLARGMPLFQVESDFEESARFGMGQSSTLAINNGLDGSQVYVAVLDGNIDTRHPALTHVEHERCYTQVKPGSANECLAPSGLGVARGPADYTWSHGTGVTGMVMGRRFADSIVPPASMPFLGPVSQSFVTAIRVTSSLDAHETGVGNVIQALDWITGEASKSGGRPFVAVNMSFGSSLATESSDQILNDDYAVQSCDRFLLANYSNPVDFIQFLAAAQRVRRSGVVPFASSGNGYQYNFSNQVTLAQRQAIRTPAYPACFSPVVAVSGVWDNFTSEPALNTQTGATGTTCDASINRNACYAQRNKVTKLAAGSSTMRHPWVMYSNSTLPPGTSFPVFATSETWGQFPPAGVPGHRPQHGTSFAAPLAMGCYAQLVQAYPFLSGFPLLDRRDFITRLINEPQRSTKVDVNGAPLPEDVELPLLRCANAMARINSGQLNPATLGLSIGNRFTLSGAWSHIDINGQGFVIEVNPYPSDTAPLIFGGWFTFATSGGSGTTAQRWFAIQNTAALDTGTSTIDLGVYQTSGGVFPNGTASITQVGAGTLRFHNCVEASLSVTMYENSYVGSQSKVFKLERTQPMHRCHENDQNQAEVDGHPVIPKWEEGVRHFGRSGAWFNPATNGQGLLIEQNPNRDLPFIAWYTNSPNASGAQEERLRWFVLQPVIDPTSNHAVNGTYTSGTPPTQMSLRIYQVTGGIFATGSAVSTVDVGTASLTVTSGNIPGPCNEFSLSYNFGSNAGEFSGLAGVIPLRKIGAAHPACTGN
jgi:hypothetical protein